MFGDFFEIPWLRWLVEKTTEPGSLKKFRDKAGSVLSNVLFSYVEIGEREGDQVWFFFFFFFFLVRLCKQIAHIFFGALRKFAVSAAADAGYY